MHYINNNLIYLLLKLMEKKSSLQEKYLKSKNSKNNSDIRFVLENSYKLNNRNYNDNFEMNTSCFNSEVNDIFLENENDNYDENENNIYNNDYNKKNINTDVNYIKSEVLSDIRSIKQNNKTKNNDYTTQTSIENIYYKTFNFNKNNNEYQKNEDIKYFEKTNDKAIGNTIIHSKKYEKKTTQVNKNTTNDEMINKYRNKNDYVEKLNINVDRNKDMNVNDNKDNMIKTSLINNLLVSNNQEKIRLINDISSSMESLENSIDKTLTIINNLRKSQININLASHSNNNAMNLNQNLVQSQIKKYNFNNQYNSINNQNSIEHKNISKDLYNSDEIDKLFDNFLNEEKSINEIMLRNGLKPKLRSKSVLKETNFINYNNTISKNVLKNNGALPTGEELLHTNFNNTYYNHRFKEEEANTKINRLYINKSKLEDKNEVSVNKKMDKESCLEEIYSKQMSKYKNYLNKK